MNLRPATWVEPGERNAIVACVLAAADVQDRLRAAEPAAITPREETRSPASVVLAGVMPTRKPARLTMRDWARFYGLSPDELWEAGKLRAKNFTAQEAVEIVFRSRKPGALG